MTDGLREGQERHGGCGCLARRSGVFGGPGAEPQYPPSLELEPVHILIEMAVDLDEQAIAGTVTHTILANRDGAAAIEFDGVDLMNLSVKDSAGKAVTHGYDGQKLWVRWEQPFRAGEKRHLQLTYRVEKPASGLFFMKPTAEEPSKSLYAATDHETELARHWLPTIDLPNVRTTLEFKLTAKEQLTILANGSLVGEAANGDGTKTAHWKLDQRCPSYLVCFAIGDFVRLDDGDFEGLPVASFACRDFRPDDLRRSFGRTKEMLAWMSQKLRVKFPFPKYYQFALPAFSGAMENISLVSWSDTYVHDERIAPERTWIVDQVNVHEMAHSYFGDLVVCRDFSHAWLKESWATYMETCWLEDKRGDDEQRYDLYRNGMSYFEEADGSYSRPLVTRKFSSSWQMYDRHLYPGGACRLHTIRKDLGDQIFWNAVSDYLETNREKVVETDDFRRMLEKHSGRSLQKLFDQWVFTAGYPDIKVTFAYDKDRHQGTFEVEQKQATDEKKPALAFELKTDVSWTIAGKTMVAPVAITKARQTFSFAMAQDPDMVRFDPQGKVLHKLEMDPGDERLRRQLTQAPDVVGRILAATVLGSSGKRANVRAIVDAYNKEPFWGVRTEMLGALSRAGSEDAIAGLVGIIASETDPLVMSRVFLAAEAFRDARILTAVMARLAKGDLPPLATANAYDVLGVQRAQAPLETLKKASAQENRRYGYEAAAALHAMGASRQEAAAAFLLDRAVLGKTHFRARRGAVNGLAALAPYVDRKWREPIEERLVDLLRDPDRVIAHIAARALKNARVRSALPALETYRNSLSHQERVLMDEMLAALRKGEDEKVGALEKQVEELQVKLRKLNERMQDLEDKMTPAML